MLANWFWSSLVLSILLLWLLWHWPQPWPHLQTATVTAALERLLKPCTPADCPTCRQAGATAAEHPPTSIPVTPWRERKSRRGAMGRIATHGFACPNRTCLYVGIVDAQIHALVGDGTHGQCEPIQTLRCQACGTTFSTRRDTPLYRLKTASQHLAEVLTALAEGLSVAAAVRVFGHRHATITTWLTRAGAHSAILHGNVFRALQEIEQVQWTLEDCEEDVPASAKLARALREFRGYIEANEQFIPNYGERYRYGEAIATGFVESTVNQVVSKRMVKKQQMRWTKKGAHLLLQVRSQVLNDDLRATFERWYPSMERREVPQREAA